MPDDSIVSSNETNDSHLKAFDCCDDSESQLGPAKKHTQKKKESEIRAGLSSPYRMSYDETTVP